MGGDVVIAGGGISGLSLALALRALGLRPRVFEAQPSVGGKIRSSRIAGFLVETGPQSFAFKDPPASALVAGLQLEARLLPASESARRRAVIADGRLAPVPLDAPGLARTSILPLRAKLRLLLELALPRGPAAAGDEESIARFARRRFGPTGAERFFFPLVSGLYTGDPALLSLPAAFPLLAKLERDRRSILWGALAHRRSAPPLVPLLASFQDGMETLPSEIARRLGEDLRVGSKVVAVRSSGKRWRVEVNSGAGPESFDAEAVVLALPAYEAGPVLHEQDAALADSVHSIRYGPLAVAYLGYRHEDLRLPDAYGFWASPAESPSLLGAVFTSRIFSNRAPPGHHLVACRLGGSREPGLLDLPGEAIAERAHRELVRLLGAKAAPAFAQVVRHRQALPQYELGHRERVEALESQLARHPGLYLAGNAYRGLGILDCLRQAQPLALRIAGRLGLPPATTP